MGYYKKAERQQIHHDDMHGTDGPLHVQDVRDKRPMDDVFIGAMNEEVFPATQTSMVSIKPAAATTNSRKTKADVGALPAPT